MGQTHSKTQLPMQEIVRPEARESDPLQEGIELGREYAELAMRRIGAWAEEHPGKVLLAGVAAGFVLGQLLFRRRRTLLELDDD